MTVFDAFQYDYVGCYLLYMMYLIKKDMKFLAVESIAVYLARCLYCNSFVYNCT